MTNLISNAIKYAAGKPIEITLAAEGDKARLVVRDEGIGIDPSDVTRIFERFERAVPARHYGRLVSTRPGEGLTFTVEIPISPAPPALVRAGPRSP